MPDLIVTPGAADANAYADLDEFQAYCDARLNTAALIKATKEDDQIRALIEGAAFINRLDLDVIRATTTQALPFPCVRLRNPDDPTGAYYLETVIPTRVKTANCEMALQILRDPTTDLSLYDSNEGVIEKTVDVLTTRWAGNGKRRHGVRKFPAVLAELKPFMCGSASQIELVRG